MTLDQKATIKSIAISAIIFAVIFGIFQTFINGINYALISAPIGGIIFGVLMYFFVNSKKVKQQTELITQNGEAILYSGGANHFKNAEAVGGRLYLLNDRIEFKSHGFNIQNHAFSINLNEIKEINYYNTLGIIPTGLALKLEDGEVEKFVVNNRNIWKSHLEKHLLLPKTV